MNANNSPIRSTSHAWRFVALLGALVFLDVSTTGAQLPSVVVGTRVSVESSRPNPKVVGVVVSQTADSIAIATEQGITPVSSASIQRIRVSGGKSHGYGAARGMKFGSVVAGGAIALVFTAAYITAPEPKGDAAAGIAAYTAAGALVGALYGAAIGGALGAERWSTIYSSPVRLAVVPFPNGAAAAGLSIRF